MFSWESFIICFILLATMNYFLGVRALFSDAREQWEEEVKKIESKPQVNSEFEQKVAEGKIIPTRIEELKEKDGNIIVAYNDKTEDFLAQGLDPEELQQNLLRKFPDVIIHLTNKKKDLLAITGMKEFLENG